MSIFFRSLGTTLTAEDYLNNKEWVKRIETFFDGSDRDKDGVVTIHDSVFDVKKYSCLNSDSKVIERCRIAQIEFAAEFGIKAGISVTKGEYLRNFANLAPGEVAKVRSGEESVVHKLLNKMIDVTDPPQDGVVSREKYREFIAVTEVWSPELIDAIFDLMDTNKTGKLGRKEFIDYLYRIILTLGNVTGSTEVVDPLKQDKV